MELINKLQNDLKYNKPIVFSFLLTIFLAIIFICFIFSSLILNVISEDYREQQLSYYKIKPQIQFDNSENSTHGVYRSPTNTPLPTKMPSPTPIRDFTSLPEPSSYIPTQFANINNLKGTILYRLDNKILISSNDFTNQRILIEGTKYIDVAGWSPDGKILYYSDNSSDRTIELYSYSMETKIKKSIIKITDNYLDSSTRENDNFSVSSDGKYLLYSSNADLHLYTLENGYDKLLFSADRTGCDEGDFKTCYGYYIPTWSPDNKLATFYKSTYELGSSYIFSPLEMGANLKELRHISRTEWSKSGKYLLSFEGGYSSGPIGIITNFDNPETKYLINDNSNYSNTYEGKVSYNDNYLAFINNSNEDIKTLGLFNLKTNKVGRVFHFKKMFPDILSWSPDNKSVIISDDDSNLYLINLFTGEIGALPDKAKEIYGYIN